MLRKQSRRGRSTSGKGSPHAAKKSRSKAIVKRTGTSVNTTSLPKRSAKARASALNVLAEKRRNPHKSITQIARDREVSLETVYKYVGSELKQGYTGGRITVTKSDRLHATMLIPTTKPDVLQTLHTRSSQERYLVGLWYGAMNAAGQGDWSKMNAFPKNKFVNGIRLATSHYEVQRILDALVESEDKLESLYALRGAA